MTLLDKLRSFKSIREDEEISKDSAKYLLIYTRLMSSFINAWPEDTSFNISHGLIVVACSLNLVSTTISMIINTEDTDALVLKLFSIGALAGIFVKYAALLYKSKDFTKLIKIIRAEFWSSDILDLECDRSIHKDTKLLLVIIVTEYLAGCTCSSLMATIPFVKSSRELPYSLWLPFDWTRSPYYEILYLLQGYIAVFLMNAVFGYDSLYYTICANCTAQFKLLCYAIKCIGTGTEHEIIRKFLNIPGLIHERNPTISDEERILFICIKHHQKLIKMCNDINVAFGNGHLMQLIGSTVGICAACYRITTEPNFNDLLTCIAYYMAYVGQIFIYCAVSNELTYWSTRVSIAAYHSLWYKKKYANVKQCLSIVMLRSQNPVSMQAFGLFELNYAFFVTVMRSTFSLYTFLTKMATK